MVPSSERLTTAFTLKLPGLPKPRTDIRFALFALAKKKKIFLASLGNQRVHKIVTKTPRGNLQRSGAKQLDSCGEGDGESRGKG